ncbi:unnamed protein product [Caenorhabditis bovis]|uniref:RRM domain-containing protein n=1 Tax=Caenorhabditis bovis TaxID=2654633 RepID=A0A8S1FAZ8_9PELO|nr:unnamed protein product [Caenorhabditis bovis]
MADNGNVEIKHEPEYVPEVEIKKELQDEPLEPAQDKPQEANQNQPQQTNQDQLQDSAQVAKQGETETESIVASETSNVVSSIPAAQIAESQPSYVRLRGLPFSATDQEIHEFFTGLNVRSVKFTTGYDGRPSGEAYVEFPTREQGERALDYNRKEINRRYIEVFEVTENEYTFAVSRLNDVDDDKVIRMRGLPWSATEQDINQFLEGLETEEIVFGSTGGPRSRPSGDAFVKFRSADDAKKAMGYNKRTLGSRYVEIFKSSVLEFNKEKNISLGKSNRSNIPSLLSLDHTSRYGGAPSRPPPLMQSAAPYPAEPYGYHGYEDDYSRGYGRDYGRDYGREDTYGMPRDDPYRSSAAPAMSHGDGMNRVYMRGLPFDADAHDIDAFFAPLPVIGVKMGINDSNRASGDAIAEFENEMHASQALGRNKHLMGKRYVELFSPHDVPGNMKRLVWQEMRGPKAGDPPSLDPILTGFSSGRVVRGPRGPGMRNGGGRGARRHEYRRDVPPRQQRYSDTRGDWEPFGQGTQWGGYNPYNADDRQREPHASHDQYASGGNGGWGGWSQADDYSQKW